MKIVSWNVNGLRSVIGYSPWCHSKKHERLHSMLEYFKSDIICLQETKISRDKLSTDITTVKEYITFYSFCNTRSAYCGVATYIRESQKYLRPIKAQDGFTGYLKTNNSLKLITTNEILNELKQFFTENRLKELDNEGRCLITDHQTFLLFNIYFPNCGSTEDRLLFKTDYHQCIKIVMEYFIKIKKRNVILVGDLNAKYQLIDSCEKKQDKNEFYQRKSTKWFKYLINDEHGLKMIDSFKYIHPDFSKLDKLPNTCWDQYTFARQTNYGVRIDYILINHQMINNKSDQNTNKQDIEKKENIEIIDAKVLQSVMGSDHCPVSCEIIGIATTNLNKNTKVTSIPKLASRFMPEFSGKQTNLMSFFAKTTKSNNNNEKTNQVSRKRKFDSISKDNDNTNGLLPSGTMKKKQKLNKDNNNHRLKTKGKRKGKNSKPKLDKSQSNLWGFITKENTSNNLNKYETKNDDIDANLIAKIENVTTKPTKQGSSNGPLSSNGSSSSNESSSQQWKNLFGKKKKIPNCTGHNEPCALRTVIKEGFNRGKKFYVCNRGKGAPNDPNGQCNFFQWIDKPSKLRQSNKNYKGEKKLAKSY